MTNLTPRQREVLLHRIERAICWREVPSMYRDNARRIAACVLDEIDAAGSDGKAAERAVTNIAERLEREGVA